MPEPSAVQGLQEDSERVHPKRWIFFCEKKANRKRWIFLTEKNEIENAGYFFVKKKGNRKRWIISNGDNLNA